MLNLATMIVREVSHAKVNFLLSVVASAAAVGLCVALAMTSEASQRETRRVTRDLGFNLRIIPREADEFDFYNLGYSQHTMPEEFVHRMAQHENLSYEHLVATLQQRVEINGVSVILVGVAPSISGENKQPMQYEIPPGEVQIGYQVGKRLGLKRGDTFEINGVKLTVTRVAFEKGDIEDVTIQGRLSDVQQALNLPGRINEIRAIDCLCLTADKDPVRILRDELERLLPEAKVFLQSAKADARAKQRQMVEKYAAFMTPVLLVVCGALVGVLSFLNVRQRTSEIGLMRALGYGSSRIATLILGRAMLVGLLGAVVGYGLGTWLALQYGPGVFQVTGGSIRATPWLLGVAVVVTPLFTAVASAIPAVAAVAQDPAVTLRAD